MSFNITENIKNYLKIAGAVLVVILLGLAIAYVYNERSLEPDEDERVIISSNTVHEIKVLDRNEEEEALYYENSIQSAEIQDSSSLQITTWAEREESAPVLDETTWYNYYGELVRLIQAKNLESAIILSNYIYYGYKIENMDWYYLVYACTFLSDFETGFWQRQELLGQIDDPTIYVLLFCQMAAAEQMPFLPRGNMQVLPDGTIKNFYIQKVEDGGRYYSEAYRYFSDWDNTIVKKITVMYDDGSSYDIYFAKNDVYGVKMITNIKRSVTDDIAVTYDEYFEFMGEDPKDLIYDG